MNVEPLASKRAHRAQMSAQSRHTIIHSLLPAATQSVIHLSQAVKHDKQASIQFFEFFMAYFLSIDIRVKP